MWHKTISSWKYLKPFFCLFAGDPVLHLCPAAHYCDGLPGSDFDGGTGPRPCPLYTYRSSLGAGSKGDCLTCPPGSHCNSTGGTHCIPHDRLQPLIKEIKITNTYIRFLYFFYLKWFFFPLFHSTSFCSCCIMKCKMRRNSPLSGGFEFAFVKTDERKLPFLGCIHFAMFVHYYTIAWVCASDKSEGGIMWLNI